mmetsp:Transcript_42458/g.95952  ORF Transcript_42458/g.95952 Transcript_42458/m.95952 type:complete len:243 (-) Transcript_42458:626-1354(-)
MLSLAPAILPTPMRCTPLQRAAAVMEVVEDPEPPPLDERIDFRTGQPEGYYTRPLIETLRVGDKILAGDVGFDPLKIADTPESLAWMREAEIKHARLAMLATVGWPLSELLNKPLSQATGMASLLEEDGRAPSLLNGGLGGVGLVYWVAVLGLGIAVEQKTIDVQLFNGKREPDYLPGMIGFDPLGQDSPFFRDAEVWNGRVAMMAITAFAIEEYATKAPIIENTPFFFKPIWAMGLGLPSM